MLPILKTEAFLKDWDNHTDWYLYETGMDELGAMELASRFNRAVEATLEVIAKHPGLGRPRAVQFSDLTGYRGINVVAPFSRFRIYYRVIAEKIHIERLLEGHLLSAGDYR